MAVYGVMTVLNSQGREVRPCGSDAWVKLDGRRCRYNLLSDAVQHFLKRDPYRVIVVKGELRDGERMTPMTWTQGGNVHLVCAGCTNRARILALIN